MPDGFVHGVGWFEIVWRLCEDLEPLVVEAESATGQAFEVLQVKEKFGGLRFYANYTTGYAKAYRHSQSGIASHLRHLRPAGHTT
jgi:hypothetical protein